MRLFILTLLVIFTFIPSALQAQLYDVGYDQNPPGIKWKRIETPHYEIIFPEELTYEAQRVANTAEYVYEPVSRTLEVFPKRIPLVLTNRTVISNGYVRLAPWKTEWYNTPTQTSLLGTGEWYNLLASHELRHAAQFDKANSGFTKIAAILFGDIGREIFSVFSIPMWFWEGDAVGMETALTSSGRGSMPEFDMDIRTILLSGERYSYYKAYLQSYKDWYPDFYHLGYLLVTDVKRKYGPQAWSKVIDHTSTLSFSPFVFSSSLKDMTGKKVTGIYEETMDGLEEMWRKQLEGLTFTGGDTINTDEKKVWTSYEVPQYAPDGSILAVKWGMADPAQLAHLKSDGKADKLVQLSPLDRRISSGGGKIVWNTIDLDVRWGLRNHTAIMLYDLETGKTERIAENTRLFAPAISSDGRNIAAVEFTPERQCALVVLDSQTGEAVKRFPTPNNDFLTYPSWSDDGRWIVFSRQKTSGKALTIVDAQTGEMRDIMPCTDENIKTPAFYRNYVLYGSPYSGIDNIYAIDIDTLQRYQVTCRKFGAFDPAVSPDGTKLAFKDYTVKGFNVVETSLDPSDWVKIEEVEDRNIRFYEPLIKQEQGKNIFVDENIPKKQYEVKNYSPIAHALKIHSWAVLPLPPYLSAAVYSNDLLNTASISGGFDYNIDEKVGGVFLNTSYAGLFPIFDVGVRYGGRASTYDDDNEVQTYSWRETALKFGIRIPLELSRGPIYSSMTIGSSVEWRKISEQTYQEEFDVGDGTFVPITYQLSYQRFRSWSLRDIEPRWGQALNLTYRHTPMEDDYDGALFSGRMDLYFPGLLKHHSLRLQGVYEQQNPENYRFASEFAFPRGYDYKFHEKLYKGGVDYGMPLFYPDFSLGAFLYMKRIRTNLFYDYALGQNGSDRTEYQSVGIDLATECNFFSFYSIPFDLGVRYAYRLKDKEHKVIMLIEGVEF